MRRVNPLGLFKVLFHIGLIIHLFGCQPSKDQDFSFFVAGHVYGTPGVDNDGVHPPFAEYLNKMGNDSQFSFGVFTGDIVKDATSDDWDEIDLQIKELFKKPVYFAVGNHDVVNRELYESRYGQSYFYHKFNNNLFLFFDGNLDHWNISGSQLTMLKEALENLEDIDNIFIFVHQVIWWRWDNKYSVLKFNSEDGFKAFPNYWDQIHPLLDNLKIPVFIFSGDIGAASWSSDFMYDKVGNVHLIASGMGENNGDNFVEVEVNKNDVLLQIRFLSDGSSILLDTFIVQ